MFLRTPHSQVNFVATVAPIGELSLGNHIVYTIKIIIIKL